MVIATVTRKLSVFVPFSCAPLQRAQYLLTMKYLSEMTDEQTLTMYSGHWDCSIKKHQE
jgi:hypothetical protein